MTSLKLRLVVREEKHSKEEKNEEKKHIYNVCSMLPRLSSLVINFVAVLLIKTPFKVLIQKPCDSLYFQLLLRPKDPDFAAYKHHS